MTVIKATVYGPPNLYKQIAEAQWQHDERGDLFSQTSVLGTPLHKSGLNEYAVMFTFWDAYSGTGIWKRGTLTSGAIKSLIGLIENKFDDTVEGQQLIFAGMKISRHEYEGAKIYHMLVEAKDEESTSVDTL